MMRPSLSAVTLRAASLAREVPELARSGTSPGRTAPESTDDTAAHGLRVRAEDLAGIKAPPLSFGGADAVVLARHEGQPAIHSPSVGYVIFPDHDGAMCVPAACPPPARQQLPMFAPQRLARFDQLPLTAAAHALRQWPRVTRNGLPGSATYAGRAGVRALASARVLPVSAPDAPSHRNQGQQGVASPLIRLSFGSSVVTHSAPCVGSARPVASHPRAATLRTAASLASRCSAQASSQRESWCAHCSFFSACWRTGVQIRLFKRGVAAGVPRAPSGVRRGRHRSAASQAAPDLRVWCLGHVVAALHLGGGGSWEPCAVDVVRDADADAHHRTQHRPQVRVSAVCMQFTVWSWCSRAAQQHW